MNRRGPVAGLVRWPEWPRTGRARRGARPRSPGAGPGRDLQLVAGSVGEQQVAGLGNVAPAEDLGLLGLEELVRVEEVADLDQPMGPDLVEPLDVGLVGIADRDAQDLEVRTVLVAHLEAADRPAPDPAAGERRLVDQEQGIGVVPVAGAGLLDEPVVEVVVDGRRQDPVEPEDAGPLVVLVLVAAPPRDLDDDLDDRRERAASVDWRSPSCRGQSL